jgi:hypothetical protein
LVRGPAETLEHQVDGVAGAQGAVDAGPPRLYRPDLGW